MVTIKIWGDDPSERQIGDIVARLRNGEIGIMPTDSVYALVCDALNGKAVERLCKLKGVDPSKNVLSVICSDISMAAEYSRIDNSRFQFMKDVTPGAVTMLLETKRMLPKAFKNRKELGIRIPDCRVDRLSAEALGNPIMTTTVDTSDEDFAREPGLLDEKYAHVADFIVDAGEGGIVPTTVVDMTGDEPSVVREGLVDLDF